MDNTRMNTKYVSLEKRNKSLNAYDLFALAVLMSSIFSEYLVVRGVKLDDFMLIVSCCVLLISKKNKISVYYSSGIVMNYAIGLLSVCLSLIMYETFVVSFDEVISRIIRYGAYAFFCVIATSNTEFLHTDKILRFFRYVCLVIAAYAILQFLMFNLFKVYLPVKLLPLQWNSTKLTNTTELYQYYSVSNSGLRICGVFSEPSHLVSFLLPSIVFSMFGWGADKKHNLLELLILLGGIIVSTSLKGIVIAAITIIMCIAVPINNRSILNVSRRNLKRTKRIILIIMVALGIILVYCYSQGYLDVILRRVQNIVEGDDKSSNVRILRGYAVWAELPIFNQIFGTGNGNIGNVIYSNNITTIYDRTYAQIEYMSGLSSILVSTGLIGGIAFIPWVINLNKKLTMCGKLLLVQYILSLFCGTSIFSTYSVYCLFLCVIANALRSGSNNTINDKIIANLPNECI